MGNDKRERGKQTKCEVPLAGRSQEKFFAIPSRSSSSAGRLASRVGPFPFGADGAKFWREILS
jgi:hypothetical protein